MPSAEHEVWIAADREVVYAALTTREGLDQWWGKAVAAEPRVGSIVEFDHGLGAPMRMEITALVPDEHVAWRFVSRFDDATNPASEWYGQTFVFDLAPRRELELLGTVQDVTVLRLRNDGWPDDARWFRFCSTAWAVTLEVKLKEYCETGQVSSGMVGQG